MKTAVLLLILLLPLQFAFANRHVIYIKNDSVCSYSPSELQVAVGDTIVWVGNFTTCPLASAVVPTGALNFKNDGNDEYMYVVRVAGEYEYVSPDYATQSAPAVIYAAGTDNMQPPNNTAPLYIVQEQGQNILYSTLNTANAKSDYILNMYDETGKMRVNTHIDLGNSRYALPQLPTGIYFVRIADNETVLLAQEISQP